MTARRTYLIRVHELLNGGHQACIYDQDAEVAAVLRQRVPAELGDTLLRFFCHLLLDELPGRALPELCETLNNMREFYFESPAPSPLLPLVRSVPATGGETRERPPLQLEAEG